MIIITVVILIVLTVFFFLVSIAMIIISFYFLTPHNNFINETVKLITKNLQTGDININQWVPSFKLNNANLLIFKNELTNNHNISTTNSMGQQQQKEEKKI